MNNRDMQRLLVAAGYYKGPIDGLLGKDSRAAAFKILDRHSHLHQATATWSNQRAVIAACQLILQFAGHSPGAIDGLLGHNTREAFNDWAIANSAQEARQLDRTPLDTYSPLAGKFPSQAGCVSFYGQPGLPGSAADKAMQAKLVDVKFPFPFRIDYSLDQRVTRMRLHERCAVSAQSAVDQTVRFYGEAEFKRLGLDRFAGSYMPRKMRAGSSWSMHAFGCATDWWAQPNGLTTRCPQATFCGEEYKPFFDIWEAHGWTSLGRAIGRDWMHLQAASL